ncbi:histone H1.5-like [Astatotilapia calliptera]|uniref:histone H1.5-like n=1 Tax=Astatotilapia calliptera TaxID=8154 RepID=UPI000E4202F5|nr:histone H1.5-like [Astatotilapia calliptera]
MIRRVCTDSTDKPKKVSLSVGELIVKAVVASKERNGLSVAALKKALAAGGYDVDKNKARVKTAIKSLVAKGTLVQTKGTRTSGSFKMNKATESKAKKPAAAKAKKPAAAAKKSPKKAAAALQLLDRTKLKETIAPGVEILFPSLPSSWTWAASCLHNVACRPTAHLPASPRLDRFRVFRSTCPLHLKPMPPAPT